MINSKTKLLVVLGIIILILFVGLLFFTRSHRPDSTVSRSITAPAVSPPALDTSSWQTYVSNSSMDSSSFYQKYPDLPKTSFAFKYPGGWTVSKNTVFTNWHADTPFSIGILSLTKSNQAAINFQVGTRSDFDSRLWRDVFYPQSQQAISINGVSSIEYFRTANFQLPNAVIYRVSSNLSLLITTNLTCDPASDKSCQDVVNEINGLLNSFKFTQVL